MLRAFTPELFRTKAAARVRAFLGKPDPATQEEIETASRILNEAPIAGAPLDVARYFEAVPDVNAQGWRYTEEWPESRENPVIIAFFLQATDSLPYDSDETAWCAAFVNWCFVRVGLQGTRSSSSGSFRCEGAESLAPQPGDIAVFKNEGQDAECRGTGHVGFLLEDLGDDIEVLGGNQSDRIKTSRYHKTFENGQPIALMSIRDIGSFE